MVDAGGELSFLQGEEQDFIYTSLENALRAAFKLAPAEGFYICIERAASRPFPYRFRTNNGSKVHYAALRIIFYHISHPPTQNIVHTKFHDHSLKCKN